MVVDSPSLEDAVADQFLLRGGTMTFPDHQPLTDAGFDRLGEFLEKCIGGRAMNLEELDGFFTALLTGPDLVMPSEYLPEVFGGEISETCNFASLAEVNEILGLIMQHWNAVSAALRKGQGFLPVLLKDEDGTYKGNDWARGFMRGVDLRKGSWIEFFQEEDRVAYILPMLILVHEHDEDPESRPGAITPEKRDKLIGTLIAGVMGAYRYFRAHARSGPVVPRQRSVVKIGRNELCPCGSGKKYKRCCGDGPVH
jgi:uncharacterized protein